MFTTNRDIKLLFAATHGNADRSHVIKQLNNYINTWLLWTAITMHKSTIKLQETMFTLMC